MKNILRFLLILLLTTAAFLAGTYWKINQTVNEKDNQQDTLKLTTTPATTFTEEKIAPERKNLPRKGLTDAEMETISLFEKATPSVVFITTSDVRRDYYTRSLKEYKSGSGSGFIWDDQGHIITNYHVIQNADRATVTLSDQSTYQAKLVGKAPSKDLAVLKIDAPIEKLRPLQKGRSNDLRVGQSVYAIGNPFGLDQTLTTGIVSALGREINSVANVPIRDVIQTDAAINPGNSGGPLLNSSGELIGVNTAIYSPSGASAGIGFSIPVDAVNWVVPDLIQYGVIQRPTMGIDFVQQRTLRQIGVKGLMISYVGSNSAAEKAGMRAPYRDAKGTLHWGDIIVAIDGEPIESENDYLLALENYRVGDKIKVLVERENERITLDLTLDPANQ